MIENWNGFDYLPDSNIDSSQIGTGLQTFASPKYYGNPIDNTLDSNEIQKLIIEKLKAREPELLCKSISYDECG